MMRYKESPKPPPPGMVPVGFENKLMHASFRVGNSVLMASDGCETIPKFSGFSLAISATDEEDARKMFTALAQGGETDAVDQNILVALLRNAYRQVRHGLDG